MQGEKEEYAIIFGESRFFAYLCGNKIWTASRCCCNQILFVNTELAVREDGEFFYAGNEGYISIYIGKFYLLVINFFIIIAKNF